MSAIPDRALDKVSTSEVWSYDRTTRAFGSLWFFLLALLAAFAIGAPSNRPWPSLFSSFCLVIIYTLFALFIMIRPPPKAQAEGLLPKIAAFSGSYGIWALGLFHNTDQMLLNLASSVCVLTGTIMTLVTILYLGKSFSLVPQARSVVQTGPYRWIRHPLYLSEEIAIIGVLLQSLSPASVILVIAHCGIQVCRIRYEEDLLRCSCPEYSAYEASRWRLIPYVW